MARREEPLELLRPPAHRGPLIAAGAVLLTVGIALEEQRLDEKIPNGIHVLFVAAAAALVLGLGLQAPLEHGRPAAYRWLLLALALAFVLLLLGAGALAAGLRPRRPLPPEPDGYSVKRPLASRAAEEAGAAHADDEREARGTIILRVRNDDPPAR